MSKKTKIILISSIVLLLVVMAFIPTIKKYSSIGKKQDKSESSNFKKRDNLLEVKAMVLKFETLNDVFRTKGILLPDEEVDLTFESSGKITDIFFKEGSLVSKGQLLAKINDKPLQAELKKLETQLPLANERLFRQKSLLAKDAVSQETYEIVVTELEKLKADIELIKSRIAQTELRAPFSGVVGLRLVSNGAYASPSTVVSTLTKISPLKLEFSVNERQVNDIHSGTPLTFTIENDKINYKASVYAVEYKLDEKTLSLKARAIYPNSGNKLRAGQSASIEINMKQITKTLVVPSIATVAEMGRDIAFIYKNGKAKQIVLSKGIRTENSVQITDGLQVGDTLLTTGVMQLRDGMSVKIVDLISE